MDQKAELEKAIRKSRIRMMAWLALLEAEQDGRWAGKILWRKLKAHFLARFAR
jgi:hypothetical protein